ncbi:cytochrome P450 [Camillea tinctor]|nr:cytochrome P450 [Camillea tinctor]
MSSLARFMESHLRMPSATVLLYIIAGVSVTYFVVLGVYNHFFHPLAKFPGPFLGSITDWYLVYVICSVPTLGLELHKKYGPIVRLAPNLLSFSDATLLPRVYHRSADKPKFYSSWIFGNTSAMFQSLKHEDHYAKKKLVAPCFSMNALKANYEGKIDERIDEFCVKLRERSSIPGKPVDFSEHLRWFLSDVWSHLAYGQPKGFVAQGRDVQGLMASLQGMYSLSAKAAVMPWLVPLLRNPWWRKHVWSSTRTFKNMDNLFSNYETMMDLRKSNKGLEKEKLIFDDLDPSKNPGEYQFSPDDLKAEVITFTAATLDGVAAFVSPFMDNLLTRPEAYARVVAEIQAADRAGALSRPVVTYDETAQLTYFTACVRETLRRDPPAQTILPRLVSRPGYALFDGAAHVPAGAQMGASPYIIHRDERVFGPDPEVWRPERWIQEESGMGPREHEAYVKRMEKYGMWWGYGDRECTGRYYAQLEMQKLCVEMLRRFDVRSANEENRFKYARWAVGMFWNQQIIFRERVRGS